jgi:hypothetical protein
MSGSMKRLIPLCLASTLALAACHAQVEGNGELGTEQRAVAPFDALEVGVGIEATITADAAGQAVTLSGDSNLLQYIQTVVEAGALKVRLHGIDRIDPIIPLRLAVQATALHRLRATEASILVVSGAGSDAADFSFEVEAAGRSNVHLAGPGGQRLLVKLAGVSGLDATGYPVDEANVLVVGGSLLSLRASGDPVGNASDHNSSVVITGGGTCAALALSSGATCQAH